jgi:hypothetical protein
MIRWIKPNNRMVSVLLVLAWVAVTGCTTHNYYSGQPAVVTSCKTPGITRRLHSVLNNTTFLLKVYKNSEYLGQLQPGEILAIKQAWLETQFVVTVTGYENGVYVGAAYWRYQFDVPETFIVSKLDPVNQ